MASTRRLILLTGPQAGRVFELTDDRITVGRNADCTLHLDEESVSHQHAEIVVDAGRVRIRDNQSINGTLVNGKPVTEAELKSGDTVTFGEVVVRFTVSDTAPAKPVSAPTSSAPQPAASSSPHLAPLPFVETAPRFRPIPAAEAVPEHLAPLPSDLLVGGRVAEPKETILDNRALVGGLIVCVLVLMIGLVWKMRPSVLDTIRRLEDFQFTVADPTVEKFDLKEPVRAVIQETRVDLNSESLAPPGDGAETTELPDIHISTKPDAGESSTMFIATPNKDVAVADIDVAALTGAGDVTMPKADVMDAPSEISVQSDKVEWALPVIAAVTDAPADIFKYAEPTPSDKIGTHYINTAPRPGRPIKSPMPKAWGPQDQVAKGTLGTVNINLFGTGTRFMLSGSRGGGLRSRTAVDSALHWLAMHQEPDGMWLAKKYEGADEADLGVTGLAVLAFMGAGNTPRKGEYMRTVSKALEAIIRQQDESSGRIGQKYSLYTHAICTIAVSEAYGRTRDERYAAAAQKAIGFSEKAVNSDGGWRYQPKSEASDMSVTAWFVQAFKTAKLADLKFNNAIYSQSLTFVDSCTDKGGSKDSSGAVGYMYAANQAYSPQQNGSSALTSASMMIRQFTGMGVKNHLLVKGAEITRTSPPDWAKKDFYYWYYSTYAMHNMGEEYRLWWNGKIRDVLLNHQSREEPNAGSWDPKGDRWAQTGGRVYTTALGALCLEVYYRYNDALTSFGVAPDIDELLME
jgi:pSer/pThr/pTyr-binding forkhead associated (FHA) protein